MLKYSPLYHSKLKRKKQNSSSQIWLASYFSCSCLASPTWAISSGPINSHKYNLSTDLWSYWPDNIVPVNVCRCWCIFRTPHIYCERRHGKNQWQLPWIAHMPHIRAKINIPYEYDTVLIFDFHSVEIREEKKMCVCVCLWPQYEITVNHQSTRQRYVSHRTLLFSTKKKWNQIMRSWKWYNLSDTHQECVAVQS